MGIIVFAAVGISVVLLTLVVTAVRRRHGLVWSAFAAVAGLALIGTWMVLVWRGAGLLVFGAVLMAWVLSPLAWRLWRSLQ